MIDKVLNKCKQKLRYRIKQCNIKESFEIINNISEHITLVQLIETVRNLNIAMIISGNGIFDSNYDK